ncbi:hypothetical protein I5E68_09855 [Novosphingobium sp. YJ-S2-02]|uniref:Uncharacterized protein n=1 Tax=Novosphingobium aureum TaxID=2792964 RepID=A0A931HD62_9SPHN|nr:hypothetical protein [Novosphingobium aureum]MBH0113249.1 hypothetical protein [Novosphingobium aureum]
MPIDQEARDAASRALAQISAHEDICAIRYQAIRDEVSGIRDEVSGIKGMLKWAGTTSFLIVVSLLGFLANAQLEANDERARQQQQMIDALQEKLRHEQTPPRRNP